MGTRWLTTLFGVCTVAAFGSVFAQTYAVQRIGGSESAPKWTLPASGLAPANGSLETGAERGHRDSPAADRAEERRRLDRQDSRLRLDAARQMPVNKIGTGAPGGTR